MFRQFLGSIPSPMPRNTRPHRICTLQGISYCLEIKVGNLMIVQSYNSLPEESTENPS
jgi:hypothetical protein